MAEKLLTTQQAAEVLGMTEPQVEQLVLEGRLIAYRVGGKYLRFRPEQVERLRQHLANPPARAATPTFTLGPAPSDVAELTYTWGERLRDFLYFNDFYLVSLALLLVVLYAIFRW